MNSVKRRWLSFGLVLLEAMSCGLPCIAFDSAQGAHEIIENGRNGYLIGERSIETMADEVCRLLSDKEELHRLSLGALNTADDFSYEKTKAAWLDLMNKIEKDVDSALSRARNIAAPINAQRFPLDIPCKINGSCVNCKNRDTICCEFLITRYSRHANRFHIILVNDDLGF